MNQSQAVAHQTAQRMNQPHSFKEVKIIRFILAGHLGDNLPDAERLINDYLNQGWTIEAAGGAGGDACILGLPPSARIEEVTSAAWAIGFIVLCRSIPHAATQWDGHSTSGNRASNGTTEA